MGTSYGASKFPSLFNSCILWAPLSHSAGVSGDIDEFPIIPAGVTVTNTGTFTKDDLGNNKSVLKFDGSTNYISLSDNASWNLYESDFTIIGWIRFTSDASYKRFLSQVADVNNRVLFEFDLSLGKLQIYGGVSGSNTFNYNCSITPSISTWYHVTIQRSGSNCLVYINAISQTITTVTAFTGTTNIAAPLVIGADIVTPTYTPCNMKDLMIFTRALSLPEIKLLMNRTNPVTGEGLIDTGRYWRLS